MLKLIPTLCFVFLILISNNFSQSNGVLLYSQTSPGSGGVISADYGMGHTYNCNVAEDFIASGKWLIQQIIVKGSYSDTNVLADGFNIYFYSNNNNKPDSLVYFASNQSYSTSDNVFFIELEHSVELTVGHYWVSVQAILNWNNFPYETWDWFKINGTYDIEAQFKNQSGTFGCSTFWNPISNCWNVPETDMYFELYGSAIIVGVEDNTQLPQIFALDQNYPNPFNPSTTIKYSIAQSSNVVIKIFDVLGKEVATLVNEEKPVGSYEVEFDASTLTSGIYFYKFQTGSFVDMKKMLLLK